MMKRGGLLLVALSLVFGAAVPRGWMPTASAAGFSISLCSTGLSAAARDEAFAAAYALMADALGESGQQDDGDDAAADGACDYAPPALAPLPQAPAASSAGLLPARLVAGISPAVAVGHGLAAPPPPATGPPLLR